MNQKIRRPYKAPKAVIFDSVEAWFKHTCARGLSLPVEDARMCGKPQHLPRCEDCRGKYRLCKSKVDCKWEYIQAVEKPRGEPHYKPEQLDRAIDVRQCFEDIPEEALQVFWLNFKGLSLREIAERGGVSHGTVRNVLLDVIAVVHARMRLKGLIGD